MSALDPIVSRNVSVEEAIQTVKRTKGKAIFLACSQLAHATDKPGFGYTVSANVEVSKRLVFKYLNDAYSPRMRAIAEIRVAECSTCLFIGSIP